MTASPEPELPSSVNDVERGLIARYLWRLFATSELPARTQRMMLFWLHERTVWLNLPLTEKLLAALTNRYAPEFDPAKLDRIFIAERRELLALLDGTAKATGRPEPLSSNIEHIVKELELPPGTLKLIGLIACHNRYEQVRFLCDYLHDQGLALPRIMALLTAEPIRSIEELTAPNGELVASGLLQFKEGDYLAGPHGRYSIPQRLNACLEGDFKSFADLRDAILGAPVTAGITLDDYEHVAADRDLVVGVLRGAGVEGSKGVNLLLYGPPGSGKTELAKAAPRAAGLTLYEAGEEASGGEADRSARLADLVFTLRLLAGSGRTAVLFDEMEDVAWQFMKRGGSKIYLNRLLENNPVPIVWTSNNVGEIDPAIVRRMTLAVELKTPPASQRERILARLAERMGLVLAADDVKWLARRIEATPAVIENALRAARFSGGGAAAIEQAALGIMRAISGQVARRPTAFPDFQPEITCTNHDLNALTERIVQGGKVNFSLCLSGPPGTGKSAYARHLARRLGLEVVQKRASDLLGAFVGESEKRIALAFEEAREGGHFLIFDEADSLLMDRREAVRSWEISQVNEMLTWMEEHPYPVCFTTNLMDRLDQASLRRFTFHVRYDFLDKSALERAWHIFFGPVPMPAEARAIENLTPGDFAQARKQAEVLGVLDAPTRLVTLLQELARAKSGRPAGMGFVR